MEGVLPRWLEMPDQHAVVVFMGDEGKAILIATTSSARDLVKKRLGGESAMDRQAEPREPRSGSSKRIPDGERAHLAGGSMDLRSVTREVCAVEVGSVFEAEMVFLRLTRAYLPDLCRVVAEKWRAWFVHVDAAAQHPRWTKTNLSVGGSEGSTVPTAGFILGPLPDKDSAGRFLESIVDCFDLCRYHNILVQIPSGIACTYKEMGRCPAPCDGSESMASYRERVRNAAEAVCVGTGSDGASIASTRLEAIGAEWKDEMLAAAGRGEFELAAALRNRVQRLEKLQHRAFGHVRDIRDCRWIIVQRGTRSGNSARARIFLFDACGKTGEIERIADVDARNAEEGAKEAAARLEECVTRTGKVDSLNIDEGFEAPKSSDDFGLVTRHLFMGAAKRSGAWIHWSKASPNMPIEALRGALAQIARVRQESAAVETQEIGGEHRV